MFLPVSRAEMERRGWDRPDFVFVSGDAYVDHPSFGLAIISRLLEADGFRVAVLAQPDWTDPKAFLRFGLPRLGLLVSSGVVDSMVNHYTASKKRRGDDSYSPGGKAGRRPDRAVITYCNRLRSALRETPVILGGVEAGLRRFAHYDYWDDRIRRSILIDSGADLIVYGMGETAILEVARRLRDGEAISRIRDVRGTVYLDTGPGIAERISAAERDGQKRPDGGALRFIELPSGEDVLRAKTAYAQSFMTEYDEQDPIRGNVLYQRHGGAVVVQNPPALPLPPERLDHIYALPYERAAHPSYEPEGGVPALAEVKFGITSHRGCFGGCAFCALNFHQGRIVQKRSIPSILAEAELITRLPGFKGYIHDVGGPSANFRNPSCKKQLRAGTCKGRQCLSPRPCKNLEVSHRDYLNLLRGVRGVPGVKKAFVRSGVRYDYVMLDRDRTFLSELCEHHVSGQLKVAPEHISKDVLALMGKPGREVYEAFCAEFLKINIGLNSAGRLASKQFLVPYLISGHPGSQLKDAVALAEYLCQKRYSPEQVQDFYPTPGTLSTCMYYTGIDPRTMKKVHVPGREEKAMQRALLQYRKPENRDLVEKALRLASRADLIGYGAGCLVRPKRGEGHTGQSDGNKRRATAAPKSSDGRGRRRRF